MISKLKTDPATQKKMKRILLEASLRLAALAAFAMPAAASLDGYWPLNETTGTVAPNVAPGGTNATLFNGATWVTDASRGQVLSSRLALGQRHCVSVEPVDPWR